MRVAFVTVGDTGRKTGGYLYNARVLAGLQERGVEVEEIVTGGSSPQEQLASTLRVGSMLINPSSFDVILVDALARIAVAPHLDRWRASRPVVVLVHELPSVAGGSPQAEDATNQQAYEEPLLRADRLVAVSEHGRGLLEARGVSPERISIVPPGLDRLVIRDKIQPVRRPGPVRALCVAQWIPRKGILTLIEAWVLRPRPNAVLDLVGETDVVPSYAASVRKEIASAPAGSVLISGPVDDAALSDAYDAADLFVLPSRYEGYGMAYAEAISFGLPVVACGVGPVPRLVGPDAALLVPPDDVGALADAIDLLMGDPGLRSRMSAAARRRAAALPRWEETVSGLYKALQEAVSRGPDPAGAR